MPETRYKKGESVTFQFGARAVRGIIKEDRGPIGIKGRRLYLVEYQFESHSQDSSFIELPAEELERSIPTVPA